MQETNKSSESLLNQKVVQQESEILMLEAKLDEYKKDFEQLSSIHRKCSSQKEKISVGIQVNLQHGYIHKSTYIPVCQL